MRSMSTAAVGAARRARHDRDQVRLRPGAVRRLHRACRRRGDALFTRRPRHYGKPRTELITRSLLLLSITAIVAAGIVATVIMLGMCGMRVRSEERRVGKEGRR